MTFTLCGMWSGYSGKYIDHILIIIVFIEAMLTSSPPPLHKNIHTSHSHTTHMCTHTYTRGGGGGEGVTLALTRR